MENFPKYHLSYVHFYNYELLFIHTIIFQANIFKKKPSKVRRDKKEICTVGNVQLKIISVKSKRKKGIRGFSRNFYSQRFVDVISIGTREKEIK